MKEHFAGYYPFSNSQLKDLLSNATIVFGAFVLLDLYRISYWDVFFNVLRNNNLCDRVWLPFDTVWLYHKRLPEVINEQIELVRTAESHLIKFKQSIDDPFGHPYINKDLTMRYQSFVSEVEESLRNDIKYLSGNLSHSDLKNRITELFFGKIGDAYDDQKLLQLYAESLIKHKHQEPPCVSFSSSSLDRIKHNRYIVWKQLQQYAIQNSCPIILVLNRITPNWFSIYPEDIVLPHHKLVNEFKSKTGQDIHIISVYDFVRHFGRKVNKVGDLLTQLHKRPILGNIQKIETNRDSQIKG